MLMRGGIFGVHRVARHLWRMCFALFIASGSFFLGQQKVMPAAIQGSPFLYISAFLPLLLLIFWLVRVRFRNAYDGAPRAVVPKIAGEKLAPASVSNQSLGKTVQSA
jgi:hypothetical protein